MYSIFDVVKFMLLDFIQQDLVYLVMMIILFSVIGFSFFNKR